MKIVINSSSSSPRVSELGFVVAVSTVDASENLEVTKAELHVLKCRGSKSDQAKTNNNKPRRSGGASAEVGTVNEIAAFQPRDL